jgi:transcription elongation factor GreA
MREIKRKLNEELKALEHEFRVELPKEIRTAVAMGDLRENSEYKSALERQAYVKARISQLRERLASLSTMSMSQIPKDKAGLGSKLNLLDLDSDEEISYQLVFPEGADLENGLISVASPIGRSLMGHTEGDRVRVKIPSGTKRFEILELRTLHDQQD